MKRTRKLGLTLAAVGVGLATLSATAASAAVVCNPREHVCWHVRQQYAYQPAFGVVVHPDNWRWRAHERYVWREHAGRGYWRHGQWVRF